MMLRILKRYYPIRKVFFVIGELVVFCLYVMLASWITDERQAVFYDKWSFFRAVLFSLTFQLSLYYHELYNFDTENTIAESWLRLFQSLGFAIIFLGMIYLIFPAASISKKAFVISVGFVIVFVVVWRYIYSAILSRQLFSQKIILLGSGELAQNIIKEITHGKDSGYTVACISAESADDIAFFPENNNTIAVYRKNHEGLCRLARELMINRIVVAIKEKRGGFPTEELLKCRINGIDILEGVTFYEMLTGKLIVNLVPPSWLIYEDGFKKSLVRRIIKRTTDIVFSVIFLILMLPFLAILALLIRIDSEGNILYTQERVGEKGKVFRIYKFRSMVKDAEKIKGAEWTEENDPRITRIGRFMRKYRLDELPQFWNILKGDMSVVGPRPEQPRYVKVLEQIIPYYRERHSVKPGLSGWAQVNYGYGASVEDAREKLNYDLFYIKNMSILLDIVIIFRTIKTVLFGKGGR